MSHFMELCKHNSPRTRFSYGKGINTFVNWADEKELLDTKDLQIEPGRTATGRLGRKLFLTPVEFINVKASIFREEVRETFCLSPPLQKRFQICGPSCSASPI